jgi:micrococcal nuclease
LPACRSPVALLCLVALSACSLKVEPGPLACGPSRARVSRVIDGDTIELSSGERVRYLLVDTPESGSREECWGREAADSNRSLVAGREVALEYDVECRDRYDRLLAHVWVDQILVGEELLSRGDACVLWIPPNGADRIDRFSSLEARARSQGRGLWGACSTLPC